MTTARGRLASGLLALLWLSACVETLHPRQRPNAQALPPIEFSHADLDRVLQRFVDDQGLVDYEGLAREPFVLGTYLGQVAAYSPASHPALFPTEADRLAYWLNAYDAIVLRMVLEHYPIRSVMEVRTAWWNSLLPEGAGFFLGQRFPLGGRSTSLYALENRILRVRFADPRIHFALNCASLGCPRLPRHAFVPDRLEEQLATETRRFLAEPRNFRVDSATHSVWLSSIFDWYEGDFRRWQQRRGGPPTVLGFIVDEAAPAIADDAAHAATEGFTVRFVDYDWRLNDRALGPRPPDPVPEARPRRATAGP